MWKSVIFLISVALFVTIQVGKSILRTCIVTKNAKLYLERKYRLFSHRIVSQFLVLLRRKILVFCHLLPHIFGAWKGHWNATIFQPRKATIVIYECFGHTSLCRYFFSIHTPPKREFRGAQVGGWLYNCRIVVIVVLFQKKEFQKAAAFFLSKKQTFKKFWLGFIKNDNFGNFLQEKPKSFNDQWWSDLLQKTETHPLKLIGIITEFLLEQKNSHNTNLIFSALNYVMVGHIWKWWPK